MSRGIQGQSCHDVKRRVSKSSSRVGAAEDSTVTVRERVSSRVKTLPGAKPCVFTGMVAPGGGGSRVCVSAVAAP